MTLRDRTELMFAQRFTGPPSFSRSSRPGPNENHCRNMEYPFWTVKSTHFLSMWVGCIPFRISLRYAR